jgi:hypothetical protein
MDDICEMWSLPWHALQRSLANGTGDDAPNHSTVGMRPVNARGAAVPPNSWLARARSRLAPSPIRR